MIVKRIALPARIAANVLPSHFLLHAGRGIDLLEKSSHDASLYHDRIAPFVTYNFVAQAARSLPLTSANEIAQSLLSTVKKAVEKTSRFRSL
jgi:hypothetical protein